MVEAAVKLSTEEEILDNISSVTDDDFGEPKEEITDDGGDNEDDQTKDDKKDEEGSKEEKEIDDGKSKDGESGSEQEDKASSDNDDTGEKGEDDKPADTPEFTGLSDSNGNLVDPQTGQVIAASGKERRQYTKEALANYHLVEKELEQAKATIQTQGQALLGSKELGLTPDEVLSGQRIMASWKADPASTLKNMLTQAQKDGIVLEGLADTAAQSTITELRNIIKDNGIGKDTQADHGPTQQHLDAAADEERALLIAHPNAKIHESTIANVIVAGKGKLNAMQAYDLVATEAAKFGYDMNKPLQPQIEAKKLELQSASKDEKADTQKAEDEKPSKPLPKGKATDEINSMETVEESFVFSDVDQSYDQIIRETIRDAKTNNEDFNL